MTEYVYEGIAICDAAHRATGNMLAGLVDPSPEGNRAFDDGRGIPLYPPGTTFQRDGIIVTASAAPTAYATVPLLRPLGYDRFAEFGSDGPTFPLLNAIGLSDAQVIGAKQNVKVMCGPRGIDWRAFVAAQGYVLP